MRHGYSAECDGIYIRPLEEADLEYLRVWRNDKKNSIFLRDIPYITAEAQKAWFSKYLDDEDTLFFAVIDNDCKRIVGSVSIYAISEDSCEVGRIIIGDPSSHGKGVGYKAMLLAITVAIKTFGIQTIKLDVHENNIPAKKIYDRIGFTTVGEHAFEKGGTELEMEINSVRFNEINPKAETIAVFGSSRDENKTS